MVNKLLLALLVIAAACVMAGSGYKFGRHLAGKDATPSAPNRLDR